MLLVFILYCYCSEFQQKKIYPKPPQDLHVGTHYPHHFTLWTSNHRTLLLVDRDLWVAPHKIAY